MVEPGDTAALARAFSSHRFDEVYDHLEANVRWVSVGESTVEGREAVIGLCKASQRELAGVRTDFTRFVVAGSDDVVAVDVVARYTAPDGDESAVSSCDVYEFDSGLLRMITSYAVELPTS